jgi:adenosylmethionine-8-amino-7-oxononanoate aminotransferase
MDAQPAQDLAAGLVAITGLPYAFFSDSGSTCVEVALKMALGHWRHLGQGQRQRIAVMQHSYHGDTIGAMSIGERGVYNAAYEPLLFGVDTIPILPRRGAGDL